jgi:pimeloyl-ACP methyl ester carboxylesterase
MRPWPDLEPFARTLTIAGREVFFYDTVNDFERPPCLLVHGLGDEADTWRSILPALAANRRVIALDLPGFGRSALPAHPISVLTYTQLIFDLLDALQVAQMTLAGHSMGAIIVQSFALAHPTRCTDLVLISGGLAAVKTPIDLTLLLFLIPGIGELVYNNLRRDPNQAYKSLERYYNHLDHLPQMERDFLFERVNQRVWSDRQRTAFLAALRSLVGWLPAQQKNLGVRLSTCRLPTTIVWGEQDRIASPENAPLLAALLPPESTRLSIVKNCGHNVQQENPCAILQILEEN